MADPVNPIEAIPGRSTVSRVLPMVETFVQRGPRLELDAKRVEEGKEARSAGGDGAWGGHAGASRPGRDTPTDQVEIAGALTQARIQFNYNEETGIVQTKIIEIGTDRVIRVVPADQIIEIAKTLRAYQDAGRASLGAVARGMNGKPLPGSLPKPEER